MFWKPAVLLYSGQKHLICWTPYIKLFSVTGYHWITLKCR